MSNTLPIFRTCGLANIPTASFLMALYSGSFVGALLIFFLPGIPEKNTMPNKQILTHLTKGRFKLILMLAPVVWMAMLLGYQAAKLTHITVFQPIFLVGQSIFPSLIGLYWFKEKDKLKLREKIAMISGLTGATVIALSI